MNKQKVLQYVSFAAKVLSVLVGAAAYADFIPAKWKAVAVGIFAIASILKDAVNRIGDYLDDGQINNSFGKVVGSAMLWVASAITAGTLLVACATIAPFSQDALTEAVRLKAQTVALVLHGAEPASQHADEITRALSDLDAHLASEQARPRNLASAAQWRLIVNHDGNLAGGFLTRWQAGRTNSAAYVREITPLIGDTFDEAIRLESAKERR